MDNVDQILYDAWSVISQLFLLPDMAVAIQLALLYIPFALFFELPFYFVIIIGVLKNYHRRMHEKSHVHAFYPKISCIVLAYREGRDVVKSVRSIVEQIYPGEIEVIVLIDGAAQNRQTLAAVNSLRPCFDQYLNRQLRVIPKWQRGGRVSSLNSGLALAKGEIVTVLDGDTSLDNDALANGVRHFADDNVVGVAGSIRVRNVYESFLTRMQQIEYSISIQTGKLGLSEFNVVNNISGAYGLFRKSFIQKIGGWDTGTAEDTRMTFRIKQYFGRHPNLRIVFAHDSVCHTDAPSTWRAFFDQRLRWDGDLFYLFVRRHSRGIRPKVLGWRNYLVTLWSELFIQIVMPLIIILYLSYIFIFYALGHVIGVLTLVYLFYLCLPLLLYVVYLFLVSERVREDRWLLCYIPMFPIYRFIARIWSAFAILIEMFTKSHQDSSMAPWWVLRKDK